MPKKFNRYWREIVGILTGLATVIGITWAGLNSLDIKYASAEDVEQTKQSIQKLNERIDYNTISDRIYKLQERLWKIEDRYGVELEKAKGSKIESLIKEEHRRLLFEKKELENQLKKLGEKK